MESDQFPQQAINQSKGDGALQGQSTPVLQGQSQNEDASKLPAAPSLSLPKGGGAIRAMAEKFDVDPSTGTGAISIPIHCSPGREGMQPQISLHYDSGAGNGPFGLGWRLSGLSSITRKTSKGLPLYNDTGADKHSDVFLISDAEDLVPHFKRDAAGNVVRGADDSPIVDRSIQNGYLVTRYSPRIEQRYTRIERWMNTANPDDIFWRTINRDNHVTIFGSSNNSRIYDPNAGANGPLRIFSWLVAEIHDTYGNAMIFNYKAEDSINIPITHVNEANRLPTTRSANRYLKSIRYGNVTPNRTSDTWAATSAFSLSPHTWKFSLVFDYGDHNPDVPSTDDTVPWPCRQDPFSDYHAGYEVRTYRLCQRILMFHHFIELKMRDYLVASFDLTYNQNSTATYLTSAMRSGYTLDSTGTAYTKSSYPPATFEYSLFPTDAELSRLTARDLDSSSLENLPIGVDGSNYQWLDLDGEGLSGILAEQGDAWFYKHNTSANNYVKPDADDTPKSVLARFEDLKIIPLKPPSKVSGNNAAHFGDVKGSGQLDVIQYNNSLWGYYERLPEKGGWTSMHTFRSFPNVDVADRDVKFIDLTGDGLPDILILADQIYCWYPSLGAEGYGEGHTVIQPFDENQGPVAMASDVEQTIYLADMSGDGLNDVVRIRNGDVCYWPNCGYGRFGAMVRMDNAPWFDYSNSFDAKRTVLADVDGSGTTDILYTGSDGVVDMYLNRSGNGFADRKRLDSLPLVDTTSVVSALDLLGNGTMCVVWSSSLPGYGERLIRYVDLMQGRKPHLLKRFDNNLGTETHIHYAPSTKFYLDDKQNGITWVTRLPFPVQCVEKLETIDHISKNRFVNTYRYSHGYYDGIEREFRGFAMVEQLDTEDFAAMSQVNSANVDVSWHVPPVRTKRWFHTGFFTDEDKISRHLAHEYFGAPPPGDEAAMTAFLDTLLPDTVFPTTPASGDALREACRALKGSVLRTEVYADDGSPKAGIPYRVQESNYTVTALQPVQDAHRHSVWTVHARESMDYYYERNVDDPRVEHNMVLRVDDYGNVLNSLFISYRRNPSKSPLSGTDKAKQETTLFVYNEHDVTNLIDDVTDYRAPGQYEFRKYELSGFRMQSGETRFQLRDFIVNGSIVMTSLPEIPYEQNMDTNAKQKRLISQERTVYRRDDLQGMLPTGQIQPLAVPGCTYRLCFTPGLFSSVYKRQIPGQPQENLIVDPKATLGGIGSQQTGHVDLDNNDQWWIPYGKVYYHPDPTATAAQELTEARGHFFMPRSFADPFNNRHVVNYDTYTLFATLVTDAVGNTTTAVVDYRVLLPSLVTDMNGNRSAAAYDALGLVAGIALMGKATENIGDSLDGFHADLAQADIDAFLANPKGPTAMTLLGKATSRNVYDVRRYWRSGDEQLPTYTSTITRETHTSDPVPAGGLKLQVSFAFSDGFSRVIQTKAQAKEGPVVDGGPVVNNRWVGSGWIIYNNKGDPVKRYEPFFDDTNDFKYAMSVGVSPITIYDPLSRPIAVLHPDHTIEKIVHDAWMEIHYDACDNSLLSDPKADPDIGSFFDNLPTSDYLPSWYDARSAGQLGPEEKANATKAAVFYNTPRTSHIDVLGRTILVEEDAGSGVKFQTHYTFDIQGNRREVVDALGRSVMKFDYSVSSDVIHQKSMESGEPWYLNDVLDRTLFSWNLRGYRFRSVYDAARRPVETWVQSGSSDEVLFQKTVYGESAPNAVSNNLRGKPYTVMDQAGVVMSNDFDFKGNLLSQGRQLTKDYKNTIDWKTPAELEPTTYVSSATYDALSRPVQMTAVDTSVTFHSYSADASLNNVYVNIRGEQTNPDPTSWSPIITNVEHNAKGQMTSVSYGNGTVLNRTYDPLRFRLQRIHTTRTSGPDLQDLNYTSDPMGNVTHIRDDAQQSTYFRNKRVDPTCDYTYDPLYRLISATGREHLGQRKGQPTSITPPQALGGTRVINPGDGNAMGTYIESYSYDAAGNILSIGHAGTDSQFPGWKRMYAYNEPSQLEPANKSNRLSSTAIGSTTDKYGYDGSAGLHGNITSMSHLSSIQWDFQDRLRVSSKQTVANGGTPETTFYVYDLTGNRIRKVTERQTATGATGPPTQLKERFYLGGYEVYRKYAGDGVEITLERVTLQIANTTETAALVETRTQGMDGGSQRLVRFQLSNYLGSACVELDEQARIISYEEFYPYGGSSYQAVASLTEAPKRYRYTGKERDIETGFDYFGARYYASWIGRWCSPDPGGLIDGQNLYAYASLNPTTNLDRHGLETEGGGSGGGNGEREEPRGAHKKRKGNPGNEPRHSKGNRRRWSDQDKHDEAERKQQNDARQKKIEGDQELRDLATAYGIADEEIPRGKLSDIQRTQLRNKIEKKRQKYGNDPTKAPRDPGAQNTAGDDNQRPVTAPGTGPGAPVTAPGANDNQGNGVQAPGAPNPSGTANAPGANGPSHPVQAPGAPGAGGDKKDDHDGPHPPPIIAKPPNNQPPADPPNKGPPENTPTENRPAAPGTDGVQDGVKEPGGNNGGGSQNPGQGGNGGSKEEDRGGPKLPSPTPQQVQVGAWAVFLGVVAWIMRGLLIVAAAA